VNVVCFLLGNSPASETSTYKIHTAGNYPEENIQHAYIYLPIISKRFVKLQQREFLGKPKKWRQGEGNNSEENGE
jgi:hypothetical protein